MNSVQHMPNIQGQIGFKWGLIDRDIMNTRRYLIHPVSGRSDQNRVSSRLTK